VLLSIGAQRAPQVRLANPSATGEIASPELSGRPRWPIVMLRSLKRGRDVSLIAAEWGTGQVVWSLMWFFLFIAWFILAFMAYDDMMRSRGMSGFAKALWAIGIVVLPFLGVFLYLIVNGGRTADRAVRQAAEGDETTRSDIGGKDRTPPADQLSTLAALHGAGKLTDDEFTAANGKVVTGRWH
jgi:hypothetical protein